MKRNFLFALSFFILCSVVGQKPTVVTQKTDGVSRPKLVVGIVVDQMRWDYLYRYNNLYKPNGGFKRFLNEGFTCENTFIPYTPTITAAGHTCVYTGSVPSIHGIVGNDWRDKLTNKTVYCTEDKTAKTVGSNTAAGEMSPRNMLTTTIGDELRLATNFQSKVIGIAIKDRGAILPAGHAANAAYWYDSKTGDFISSSYYMDELPVWVKNFNDRKLVDSLYGLNWNLALPKETYLKYSTEDIKPYENKPFGNDQPGFPYTLENFKGKDYGKISSTPYGNTLTAAMAEATVLAENLGKTSATDFLAVSFSSPDYIGHAFGPNSWEQMDDFVRLDETLGNFFSFLDANVGKGEYTVFLTADHGAAHSPGFSEEHLLPGGAFPTGNLIKEMNAQLNVKFGKDNIITGMGNYQVHLNNPLIDSADLDREGITRWIINYLQKQDAISRVFDLNNLMLTPLNSKVKEMVVNGYYPTRGGDIQMILKPGYVGGSGMGTSHGLWNPYDSHIPLLWYGWGIKQGKTNRETYMTDISATLAALLRIQMPSGCVGDVIGEVIKN